MLFKPVAYRSKILHASCVVCYRCDGDLYLTSTIIMFKPSFSDVSSALIIPISKANFQPREVLSAAHNPLLPQALLPSSDPSAKPFSFFIYS
jgi:hypothetical protein